MLTMTAKTSPKEMDTVSLEFLEGCIYLIYVKMNEEAMINEISSYNNIKFR